MRRLAGCLVVLLVLCLGASAQSATIVKSIRLSNQTGPIAPTTLYTPTYPGIFRVSVVMVLTQANGKPSSWYWGMLASKVGQTSADVQTCLLMVGSMVQGMANSVNAAVGDAGQPLVFSTVPGGVDTSGATYDVYIVVERL